MLQPARKADRVGEKYQGPFRCDRLLEFDSAEHESFRAHNVGIGLARGGFAFLIAADGIFAAGKKAFIEWQVVRSRAGGRDHAVREPETQISSAAQRQVI